MRTDRFRSFTKRGATVGVLAVVAAAGLLIVAGALVAAVLTLVF